MTSLLEMGDIAKTVASAADGNQRAIRRLYRLHVDAAWRLSYRILQRKDLAQDCTQEAFIKAFNSLDLLTEPERFSGWFIRIVHRKALDLLRREKKHEIPETNETKSTDHGTEDFLLRRRLTEAIERLSDPSQGVFVLYCLLGHTHVEISNILNIAPGTSKRRLFEARQQLQAELAMVKTDE